MSLGTIIIIILRGPRCTRICRGITRLYGFLFQMCITNILRLKFFKFKSWKQRGFFCYFWWSVVIKKRGNLSSQREIRIGIKTTPYNIDMRICIYIIYVCIPTQPYSLLYYYSIRLFAFVEKIFYSADFNEIYCYSEKVSFVLNVRFGFE